MFVCDVPPLGRRPEHRIDRLTPIRPQMGRLLEHGVSANGLTRCMQARSAPAKAECAHRRAFKVHPRCSNRGASTHTDNGDDDDTGQDDGGRARELHRDGNAVPAGPSERTGCEGARPSAVPVCLRPCRDDALCDAVQAAVAGATTTKGTAVAVPAMWSGAAMSRGLGVWQRRPLAALEERPTVSLVDVLPRPMPVRSTWRCVRDGMAEPASRSVGAGTRT
jgi:hypothetical protein